MTYITATSDVLLVRGDSSVDLKKLLGNVPWITKMRDKFRAALEEQFFKDNGW